MSDDLANRVEAFLLQRQGWVPAVEICTEFGVQDRALRATGTRPGLCSDCAISGDKGFRHVLHATDEEFGHAYARMRRHGLGELVHARQLRRKRHAAVVPRPPLVFERATGQALLLTSPNNPLVRAAAAPDEDRVQHLTVPPNRP